MGISVGWKNAGLFNERGTVKRKVEGEARERAWKYEEKLREEWETKLVRRCWEEMKGEV